MARRKQGTEMPNAMTVLENGTSASFKDSSSRPTSSQRRKDYVREGSCSSLEILPPEDLCKSAGDFMSPEDKDYRVGSAGRRPPSGRADSARSRRTPTPTKQISLQAARRRVQGTEPEDFEEDWRHSIDEENRQIERHKERIREKPQETPTYAWGGDTKEIRRSGEDNRNDRRVNPYDDLKVREENSDSDNEEDITARGHKMHHRSDRSTGVVSEGVHGKTAKSNQNLPNQKVHKHKCDSASVAASGPASSSGTVPQGAAVHKASKPKGAKQKKESESSSSEDEDDEDAKKAPNELLMELVNSLIAEDYENAQKLCQMVLMYEPDNQEALKFAPLIEEKLQLEESEDESDDDDDDSDEDESDEDGEDDEEDEDESGDDADSSPEDDEEEEGATGGKVENDDLDEGKWMELMMHMVMREFNQED